MKGNLLLTGAHGFVGRAAADALTSQGWQVHLATRIGDAGVRLDLEDPMSCAELLNGPRMDAIVHLAAKVGLSGESVSDLFAANVAGTAGLLLAAQRWNARFVFASTAIVCGSKTADITPSSPVNPDSAYGNSKWLAEQLVAASGVDAVTLRFGGVFGADGPTHLGLNRAITAAQQGRRPQLVGGGGARRNYIYVKDAALSIAHALENDIRGTHFAAGSEISTLDEMLRALCDVFLPGQTPERVNGMDAADQVIQASPILPRTRSLHEALTDIRRA